jgi:hypothetical protein
VNLRPLFAMLLLTAGALARADFTFALLGDTPYGAGEESQFANMLQDINRSDVAFAVHVGDFKNGLTSCSDQVFEQRHALFDASHHPFIYIPGDNEWTDCHRLFAGGYDPLERLAALRARFFSSANSLGKMPLKLLRQSDDPAAPRFPEHMRWAYGGVQFVALNFPGGDNNSRMPQEAATRTAAALTWLRQTFVEARSRNAPGVVVLMQANPFLRSGNPRRGYEALLAALAHESMNFPGSVLLGHGDTHIHRIDHPLKDPATGNAIANFTRAEVFGSPDVNWLQVRVTENGNRVQYSIRAGR